MLTTSSPQPGQADNTGSLPHRRFRPPRGWGGSLRTRTLAVVAGLLCVLTLLLYFPLRSILLGNTLSLEARLVATDVGRASETINARVEALARTARSYAIWDETYAFAEGGAPSYPAVNHAPDAFVAEDRDIVIIRAASGAELLHLAVDLPRGAAREPAPLPAPPPGGPNPLFTHRDEEHVPAGLLWGAEGPLMVAAAPILRSDGSGPVVGTLLLGRHIGPADLASLGDSISLKVELFDVTARLPSEVAAVLPELSAGDEPVVRPLDEGRVAGYALLADAYGQPRIILRTVEGREIYAQGQTSTLYLALALLLAVLTVGGAILLLLERTVLARLGRFSADVDAIDGNFSARLSVVGGDELGRLGSSINGMLDALERAEEGRRQEAEERLRLQGEVIEAERQLISRVSHELRTPLTPIKGFVDLLLMNSGDKLSAGQLEVLQIVRSNTERMIGLVDELLEIERAQSGRLDLKIAPVEVAPIVDSALKLFRPEAERKRQRLLATVGPLPPVEADGRRLEQILVNLVSNAVKYTPEGGSVEVSADVGQGGLLTIAVRDSGIGLTADQQKKLFTPFYRADTPLHNASNGTGLGLLITRTLAELHKGRIQVESSFGQGSTFSLIMPVTQGDP